MRKLWNLCMVLLLLSACSTEQESMRQNRIGDGTVTLEEFKLATGMKDFGTTIRIPRRSGGVAARAASMEDFVIDTDFIRKTTIDLKITYSFSIEPKVVKDKESLYNLVVYHRGENWQYVILEMKPGAAKFQALVLGQEIKLDGEIREIYHTDVARGVDCVMFSIENRHCTMEAPWCTPTHCDGCNLCVDYTNFKVCRYDMEDYNSATLVATDNDYGSGGSSQVIHHDYVFTPNFGQGNIRAIRAEWAANFYDVLEQEQQDWADHHEDAYYQIVQYYLDHYNTEEVGFAMEMLEEMMENPNLYQSIKPFLVEKNIDDSELDPCTKAIVQQLLNSHEIAEIVQRFRNPDQPFSIKFTQEHLPVNSDGTIRLGQTSPVNAENNYSIKLNSVYFNDTGATKLIKAQVILHEILHALIFSVIDNSQNLNNLDINNFELIWNTFVSNESNGIATPDHHLFLGMHYVDVMAKALQEFDTGIEVPENESPSQIYTDLAWTGLIKVPSTSATSFDSVISPADKARFYGRWNAELTRNEFNGTIPSSNNPC